MNISSKKVFIEKIKEGYKLKEFQQFRRKIYCLVNTKEELTVSISLIKKLEEKGIIDSNQDIFLDKV
jgi:hypothetical protein